jgi:hypothetical protein
MIHILANKTRDPQRHLYHKLLRYIEQFIHKRSLFYVLVCVWERSNIGIKIPIANERNRQTYFGPLNSQIILREKDSVNLGWSGPSQIMGEKEFLAALTYPPA